MAENFFHLSSINKQLTEEGSLSYLDQALWRQLNEAKTDEEYCYAWLVLNSHIISGLRKGIVVLGTPDQGPYIPVATWPADVIEEQKNLAEVTERALVERKGIVIKSENGTDSNLSFFHIAYPIRVFDRLCGSIAFEVTPRPQEQLQALMRQLQWGVILLENWILRKDFQDETLSKKRLTAAMDFAAVALQEKRFLASATAFATVLATRLNCDRVSIGFLKGKQIKVHALSHSAHFKKQMNLIRLIGNAMDESMDQHTILVYPDKSEKSNNIMRAHEELAKLHGDSAICTIPFIDKDGFVYGAMTLERSTENPFEPDIVELCDSVASLIGPILDEKRKNDRIIIKKIGESLSLQIEKVIGPGHILLKLSVILFVSIVLFFSLAKGDYRVTAKTTIEGAIQHSIVAPFTGYIFENKVRAGDTVRKGQVICSLDDRDLRLQRIKIESQKEQYLRQYRKAMAENNKANIKILREQINQADAELALINEQMSRSKMVSPFDGVIVSGDLSKSIGAPVEQGQVLFEIAPLQDYRVKLQVDEHDIGAIQIGQKGDLILNSLPDKHFPLTVEKITPVSSAKEGHNYFLVEAKLIQPSFHLRPGMEGYSKINAGERKLIWIWTHDLIDWVRLWVWSWWP